MPLKICVYTYRHFIHLHERIRKIQIWTLFAQSPFFTFCYAEDMKHQVWNLNMSAQLPKYPTTLCSANIYLQLTFNLYYIDHYQHLKHPDNYMFIQKKEIIYHIPSLLSILYIYQKLKYNTTIILSISIVRYERFRYGLCSHRAQSQTYSKIYLMKCYNL